MPESASENRTEQYNISTSSQSMLAMVHDDWFWFRNCPIQLLNKSKFGMQRAGASEGKKNPS